MKKLLLPLLLSYCFTTSAQEKSIYHKGWVDFNKNGKMDVFEDPSQPIDKRINDLLSQMTVEEKTCQLATLYGYKRVLKEEMPTESWKHEVWKDGIAKSFGKKAGHGLVGFNKFILGLAAIFNYLFLF